MNTYKLYDYLSLEGFYLTQSYGVNADSYRKYGLLWHEGEDHGDRNDPRPIVRALHDGVIVRDTDTPKDNYGNYVVIWDDVQLCATWYCHLAENSVSVGQRVKAGDAIGIMGSTGNVTGKHLHFNFVLTDANGRRLYNTKASNLGFLDPRAHKFPPGVPQYKVQWLKPGTTMPEEKVELEKSTFEKLVTNSGKWDQTVEYLEVKEDPATTPFDKIKSIIAGIKSRVKDLTNQLAISAQEVFNREEQVSRLKVQLLNEQKLYKDGLAAEKKRTEIAEQQQGVAEAKSADLQVQVENLAKEKGAALNELAVAKSQLVECKDRCTALVGGESTSYSLSELVTMIVYKLFRKKQ